MLSSCYRAFIPSLSSLLSHTTFFFCYIYTFAFLRLIYNRHTKKNIGYTVREMEQKNKLPVSAAYPVVFTCPACFKSSCACRFVRSVTSTPAIMRPISAILSCLESGVTCVVVRPSLNSFAIRRCVSAIAATCGRCVMQSTCEPVDTLWIFSAMAWATRPLTPVSTSSKMMEVTSCWEEKYSSSPASPLKARLRKRPLTAVLKAHRCLLKLKTSQGQSPFG